MKVSELIKLLADKNGDSEVLIFTPEDEFRVDFLAMKISTNSKDVYLCSNEHRAEANAMCSHVGIYE